MLFSHSSLKPISPEHYQQLTQDCHVLKTSRNKPAILLSNNNTVIKHIYHRSGFSSSTLWPYAIRFMHNSQQLQAMGFIVPEVINAFRSHELHCDIITYTRLEGSSVRELWLNNQHNALHAMPAFIAKLHQSGIYFRDLHLDNLLFHNNQYALIDLASITIKKTRIRQHASQTKPLTLSMRGRNFQHLFSKQEDQIIFADFTPELFLALYQESAQLTPKYFEKLRSQVTP